jgi:hypothetical protein
MTMMHVDVIVVRLVCAYLMHMQSEPEIRQALAMIKYALNHARHKGSVIDLTEKIVEELKKPDLDGKPPYLEANY